MKICSRWGSKKWGGARERWLWLGKRDHPSISHFVQGRGGLVVVGVKPICKGNYRVGSGSELKI